MLSTLRIDNKKLGKINYGFHLILIGIILLIQFFIMDIVAFTYLKIIENKYQRATTEKIKFYTYGEYKPIFENNYKDYELWGEPLEYKFVSFFDNGNLSEEVFFTKYGYAERIIYSDNMIKEISRADNYPQIAYFVIPLFSLIIFIVSAMHFVFRTSKGFTINAVKYHLNKIEKLCVIYTATIFISSIPIMGIKIIQGF